MEPLHPLFLRLSGRDVLVVGAGEVAARKIEELVAAGACVRVVAPEAVPSVQSLAERGAIAWAKRAFSPADVEGVWLVVAATSSADVQAAVGAAADVRRIFTVAVDDVAHCTAYGASILRRAPLTVAISSSGEAPALVRLLREILEQVLPEPDWVDAARTLRARWRRERTPMSSRFAELVRAYKSRADGHAEKIL